METADIAAAAPANLKWIILGTAKDPGTLLKSHAEANSGHAVIAVGAGHVVLVIAGPLRQTSWGQTPNSAALSHYDPKAAYVGKPLSQAFREDARSSVNIYARSP